MLEELHQPELPEPRVRLDLNPQAPLLVEHWVESCSIVTGSLLLSHVILTEGLQPLTVRFKYPPNRCTYSAIRLLHGWRHVKLLPSRRTFCVHHTTMNHLQHHFFQSHIRRVYL